MKKFTLLPGKKQRNQLLILLLILLLLIVAMLFLRQRNSNSVLQVQAVMTEVKTTLQQRNAAKLSHQIRQLEALSEKISDSSGAARVRENTALLSMIAEVWAHNEIRAIQLFAERYRHHQGRMIYLEAFDAVLPYVKQTMLNVFLKQLDLQGAYCFMFSYPPVMTGKHVKYFAAMEQFLCGDPAGAERQLKNLLRQSPDNSMLKSAISYLERLRQRGIVPRLKPVKPAVPES